MARILSPIMHVPSEIWTLGYIEDHKARPMSKGELEEHIEEFKRLKAEAGNAS